MDFLVAGVLILFSSSVLSLFFRKRHRVGIFLLILSNLVSSILILIPSIQILLYGIKSKIIIPWNLFFGSFYLELDAVSGFFLIPISILLPLSIIYGNKYFSSQNNTGGRVVRHFAMYNLFFASMVLVLVARNVVLFLLVWEITTLLSFFLVIFDSKKNENRRAGWLYLSSTHIGSVFLLLFFLIISKNSTTLDFYDFTTKLNVADANIAFILALIGFGTKAGIVPFHIWLPEAHPAAPSHISSVMSGVMIKLGIYGIIRSAMLLGGGTPWWGTMLIIVGSTSGIIGVLFALAQHDIKRLLAYHSVENIGIIILGLGLGTLGMVSGKPALVVLGFSGALLHVINHAFFKGLLFLSAGSLISGTHIRDINKLGGIIKKMPVTGITFLIGSVAISGLPPLNGFISEFLIYLGSFQGIGSSASWGTIPFMAILVSLAVIGALACACFTKAFGIIFLGEPRSPEINDAHESPWQMLIPMIILTVFCGAIGFFSYFLLPFLVMPIVEISGFAIQTINPEILHLQNLLLTLSMGFAFFIVVIAIMVLLRRILSRKRKEEYTLTWDCGYVKPSSRMQYTASSFADPIIEQFKILIHPNRKDERIGELFPKPLSFHSSISDSVSEFLFKPIYHFLLRLLKKAMILQRGSIHVYILYILLVLILLLVFKMG